MAFESYIDVSKEVKGSKKAIDFNANEVVVNGSNFDNNSDESGDINLQANRVSMILRKNKVRNLLKDIKLSATMQVKPTRRNKRRKRKRRNMSTFAINAKSLATSSINA